MNNIFYYFYLNDMKHTYVTGYTRQLLYIQQPKNHHQDHENLS